jgi:hypothetical protein
MSATAIPHASHAQIAPTYSGDSTSVRGSVGESWWILSEFGRCTVAAKTEESIAFLATSAGSPDEAQAFKKLTNANKNNSCLRNFSSIRMPRSYFRGSLAEALIERRRANGAMAPTGPGSFDGSVRSFHDFAECYDASRPDEALSLLSASRLGTAEEKKKIIEMSADFAPCLPQGVPIRFDPSETRMVIAEALYHLSAGVPVKSGQD